MGMRSLWGVVVSAAALYCLTACAAAEPTPDAYDAAWATCVGAYTELPHSLDVLAAQSGESVTRETPCQNWIDSQGETAFVSFWSDPGQYMGYLVSEAKLEVLSELGLDG